MRYSGSKRKFIKELIPIIMEGTDNNTFFIDCFMGGANILSEIPSKHKIGIEINYYVYSLWNEIKNNIYHTLAILPHDSSDLAIDDYNDIRKSYLSNDKRYTPQLIGFVGSACSYGGAWFNGYAKFNPNKNEDHIKEAYNGLIKQIKGFKYLSNTTFHCMSYDMLKPSSYKGVDGVAVPQNTVLICDPPYFGTKGYESDFNHLKFWDWVRKMSSSGIKVYVTEYEAPSDFKCIWSAKKKDGMGATRKGRKQTEKIEKMFIYSHN